MLEKVQSFPSINGVYRVVTQSKYYLGSKKEQERLRYKVGNPRLPNFRML